MTKVLNKIKNGKLRIKERVSTMTDFVFGHFHFEFSARKEKNRNFTKCTDVLSGWSRWV